MLRIASTSIAYSSALVSVDGFVIRPLILLRLRGFPSQALGLQSFVVLPESFLPFFVVPLLPCERTLPEPRKTRLHLVLTQCADIDSRADRTTKPCLLLSCYQAVDVSRLVSRALSFAKPPSDKKPGRA